ncbi:MAG: hypothetical protein AB7G20_07405 [Sulfurimonas sp.]
MKKIATEILYFMVLLLILAFMQHPDLLSSPLERVSLMAEKGNFIHPFLWTSGVYLVVGLVRLIVKYALYLKNRKKN